MALLLETLARILKQTLINKKIDTLILENFRNFKKVYYFFVTQLGKLRNPHGTEITVPWIPIKN